MIMISMTSRQRSHCFCLAPLLLQLTAADARSAQGRRRLIAAKAHVCAIRIGVWRPCVASAFLDLARCRLLFVVLRAARDRLSSRRPHPSIGALHWTRLRRARRCNASHRCEAMTAAGSRGSRLDSAVRRGRSMHCGHRMAQCAAGSVRGHGSRQGAGADTDENWAYPGNARDGTAVAGGSE